MCVYLSDQGQPPAVASSDEEHLREHLDSPPDVPLLDRPDVPLLDRPDVPLLDGPRCSSSEGPSKMRNTWRNIWDLAIGITTLSQHRAVK